MIRVLDRLTVAGSVMEWPRVRLDDVAQEFISGGTPSTKVEHYWTGDIPWITGADVTDNVVVAGRKWITQEAIDNSATHVVPKGAILLVTRTGVGKVAIAGADIAISQDLTGIVLKEGTNADFVAAAIRQKTRNLLDIQQGAIIKGVLRKDVEKLEIPLPPLSEQHRIVEILDQAERIRRLRADADAKAERILPALFIKMFGDPATNPMGWPVVQLGDVAQEFISGGTPSTKVEHYWTGDIPWITGADVTDNVVVAGRKWITREAIDNSATHVVPKGAILLVTRTGVGKVAIAGADIAISQDLTGIVLKEGTNADFVVAAIRQKTRNLLDIQQGAIIKRVLRKDVEKLEIPLPSLSIQQKFANSVAGIMKLEANRSESHRHLETLFQTSLYRAFSGDLTASWREAHKKELLQEMGR